MNVFSKKLEQLYPVVTMTDRVTRNGLVKHFASMKNVMWDEAGPKVPYMKEAIDYLQKTKGLLPQRVLLVTENETVALKTALFLKARSKELSCRSSDVSFFFDEFDIEELDDSEDLLRIVNLQLRKPMEQNLVNEYVMLMQEIGESDTVFFGGLSGIEEIREKLETIRVCPAELQCIWIHPSDLQMPWMQELLIDLQCDMLRLPKMKADYYEGVVQELLEDEPFVLAEEITPALLVRKIRKRRGVLFREEDIAWHLERAAEYARIRHPKSMILESEDFKNMALGEKKPMEKLQDMVGLPAIKQTASEIAALVQEEIHNEKLGSLHKNMLFLGNPGTGKTTCSALIADIMAESGDTNAVFISVARKDLIGEYVGHTAPRVAKKFEQARGGVLFVDEAGFLLNRNAGGYVDEAVKEFVRYMELYPDVTVIFAMYTREAKEFLQLDEGLTSRISRFVMFDDYTDEELSEIGARMLADKGYQMTPKAKEAVRSYMNTLRKDHRKTFGNAREVRRLIESAIVAASVQHYYEKKHELCITEEDIRQGWERLEQKSLQSNKLFGFTTGGECYGN